MTRPTGRATIGPAVKKELYILAFWVIVAWLVWAFVHEYESPQRVKHRTERLK